MADMFVSYSRVDRDRITGVSDAIEESGHSVWWDRTLAPGDDYAVLIEKENDAARRGIVAWSQTAPGPGLQGLGRVALLAATAFGLVRIGRASR